MPGGEGRAHVGELDSRSNLRSSDAIAARGRGGDRCSICLAGAGFSSRDSRKVLHASHEAGLPCSAAARTGVTARRGANDRRRSAGIARSRRTLRISIATGRASCLWPIDTRGMDAADVAACRAAYEFRAFGPARAPSCGCSGLNRESPRSSPLQKLARVGARLDRRGIVDLQIKGAVRFSGRLVVDLD
jgi:hypothetical protein